MVAVQDKTIPVRSGTEGEFDFPCLAISPQAMGIGCPVVEIPAQANRPGIALVGEDNPLPSFLNAPAGGRAFRQKEKKRPGDK